MNETRKMYIAWNAARNEGFVTDDPADAEQAATGNRPESAMRTYPSALAADFRDLYDDETCTIEPVELPL